MKKFTKSLIAFIATASILATFTAGCYKNGGTTDTNSCEHEISELYTDKAATCTEEGYGHGLCAKCQEVIEGVVIPIDEDAHSLEGVEWVITYPTETATGLATKTCKLSNEHVISVTLPIVTAQGTGYDSSERTVTPTAVNEGKQTLLLKNEQYGDIEFEVTLPRRELNTLADAVTVAASLGSRIRTSTGTRQDSKESASQAFSVYFGDDYTQITDTDEVGNTKYEMKYWYSLDDDGNPFGVYSQNGGSVTTISNVTEEQLLGYNWVIPSQTSSYFYGAEMILQKLYKTASDGLAEGNKTVSRYKDEFTSNKDGTISGEFSFSVYENPNFSRYTVKFTLFASGAIKTLDVTAELIRGYMIAEDEKGNKLFYQEDGVYSDGKTVHAYDKNDVIFAPVYTINTTTGESEYEYDESGNLVYDGYLTDAYGMELTDADGNKIRKIAGSTGYYSDDHDEVNYRTIHFEQEEKSSSDVVEVNPYPATSAYVKSFTITSAQMYDTGEEVAVTTNSEGKLAVTLPCNTAVNLLLGGLEGTASFVYDPVSYIYAIDAADEKVELNLNSLNNSVYPIMATYQAAKDVADENGSAHGALVMVNSHYAGTVEIYFETKSGKGQQSIVITFTRTAPTGIVAKADIYDDTSGEVEYNTTTIGGDTGRGVTLYVGQSLNFTAAASSDSETSYADASFTPSCSVDGVVKFNVESADDNIYSLVASAAGTYTITLTSTLNNAITTSFTLTVNEAPDVTTLLAGNTFTGTIQISEGGMTTVSKTMTATFTTAEITENKETKTVDVIQIDVGGSTAMYTYSVSNGVLSAKYYSGVSSDTKGFNFTFAINEAYALTVAHGIGMGNEAETVVLKLA